MEGSQQTARGQNSELDQYLASCLLAKNEAEIELAKFAQERSQNPQVKQFAQQLIADHQMAVQHLQQLAGSPAGSSRSTVRDSTRIESQNQERQQPAGESRTRDRDDDSRMQSANENRTQGTSETRSRSMTERSGSQSGELGQLAQIEEKIVEKTTQNLRAKLEQKQGAEFDHCFVGSQVIGHVQMLSALEVLQNQTSGQLQQVVRDHQPKVKQHLEQAEQLADQLMSTATRQAGATTEGATRIPR
jgi:predicted outer membrane protein